MPIMGSKTVIEEELCGVLEDVMRASERMSGCLAKHNNTFFPGCLVSSYGVDTSRSMESIDFAHGFSVEVSEGLDCAFMATIVNGAECETKGVDGCYNDKTVEKDIAEEMESIVNVKMNGDCVIGDGDFLVIMMLCIGFGDWEVLYWNEMI